MKICLLSTAWGPTFGGINAFNQDLAIGLSQVLANSGRVFCAVLDPNDADIGNAQKSGVTLIPIREKAQSEEFDTSWIYEVRAWLKQNSENDLIDWWIGHDIITGRAAVYAPEVMGGAAALIHHMSYASYQGYKRDDSSKADAQHRRQRSLFEEPAELFAVGPLLRQSCYDLSGRYPVQLVPGFPNVPKQSSPDNKLIAITFGRMERASDRIKQGRLGVAAFGEAIRLADKMPVKPKTLSSPRLLVIGVDPEEEQNEITALVDKYANRATNLLVLPFDENRVSLLQRLREANLALMLSWHEGFGLTGWEAIATEVPLIVSKQSGVYQLIDETLHGAGLGCVRSIDVRGWRGSAGDQNFTKQDLDTVATEILSAASDIPRQKDNARTLKKMLVGALGCTWQHTARQLLSALPQTDLTFGSHQDEEVRAPDFVNHLSAFVADPPSNPLPECSELTVTTTQGSSLTSFDLLPELRFGREEFELDGLMVAYGITQAALRVTLRQCQIAPGPRLGDDPAKEPHIAAKGNSTWEIRGPREDGVLLRRALGSEPLCRIHAEVTASPEIDLEVNCRSRHVVYELVPDEAKEISVTQARILEAFFNKCLRANRGVVTLSRATLRMGSKNHEAD